ncbi:MAG TPA: hypothetical protein VL088_03240, partial [Pedobacter sp.]|nr:hypothetical protein [Pedobacter sp.]
MKILLVTCLLFYSTIAISQTRTTNDLSLVNAISVKKYIGKNYRASVDIKSIPSDSTGAASLFVLQAGKSDWDFILKTRQDILAKTIDTNWHSYKATGVIDLSAQQIWLYVNIKGNGDFCYDNFALEIEVQPNEWEKTVIPNGNFEESTNPLKELKGGESQKNNKGIKISLNTSPDERYQHYLQVKTTNGKIQQIYGQEA